MIPPRPSKLLTAPKRPLKDIILNRLFESREEMDSFFIGEFKGQEVTILRIWETTRLCCEVKIGEKPKPEKKKR
jgi:hypothetical protein